MSSISRTTTIDQRDWDDLEAFRGDYLQLDYTIQDSAGSAVDITSATVTFTCYDIEAAANEFQIDTTEATEVLITSGSDGEVTVYLTDDETDTDAKTYRYSMRIVLDGGTEHTAAQGRFHILPVDYTGA